MSSGVYKLLISSNEDKQDKILLANSYLTNYIAKLTKIKQYNKQQDIKNLVIAIDKLEDNLSIEYDKNRQFIINDKIKLLTTELAKKKLEDTLPSMKELSNSHYLFLQSSFKPFVSVGYEYSKTSISPIPAFGSGIKVKVPKFGDFFNDMVVYIKLTGLKPEHKNNKVKYCNFLGHRLLNKVKFISSNNVLDEYTSEDYIFHYQFKVPDHKKNGWKKCVGQEIPIMANLTADPAYQDYRQQIPILSGPQTLKKEHTNVELFIPLLFWFQNPKLSVPNITIPFGQTFIEFDLANLDDICACADFAGDGGIFNAPTIVDFHLYTNHIYLNPDILDIYIKKIGLTLIRVHKYQEIILNQTFNEELLNELKYPIENIFIAFRPIENLEGENKMETWNLNSKLTKVNIQTPVVYDTTGSGTYNLGLNSIIYYSEKRLINELGLKADNISIFQQKSSLFYNSYLPYQYGKDTTTPVDESTYMFVFNLDPNLYQPTGYLNLSKIRRFYIYYESELIDSSNLCKMIVSAQAINFLLVRNGLLTLQYNI